MNAPLLEFKDLRVHFFTDEGVVKAVDGVDLTVERGKTMCIVGESGCGKSVMSLAALRIVQKPGRIVSGQILFHDQRWQSHRPGQAGRQGQRDSQPFAAPKSP